MEGIDETIAELKAAVAELESEEGLQRFVEGHGVQSLVFAFEWNSECLSIMFRLPCACVLSPEESQAEDNARIGVALRLAIMLIVAERDGRLLSDGEARLSVSMDAFGSRYTIYDAEGAITDSGDGWDAVVAHLCAAFPENTENLSIIWP